MRAKRPLPAQHSVTVEREGKKYQGSYLVERGMIAVQYGSRQQVTQRGDTTPKSLALIMLGELITEDPEKW